MTAALDYLHPSIHRLTATTTTTSSLFRAIRRMPISYVCIYSICLFICLFVCLSVCLSVRPSARPPARPPPSHHPPSHRCCCLSKRSFSFHAVGTFSADCSSQLTNQDRSACRPCKRHADRNRRGRPTFPLQLCTHRFVGLCNRTCLLEAVVKSRRVKQGKSHQQAGLFAPLPSASLPPSTTYVPTWHWQQHLACEKPCSAEHLHSTAHVVLRAISLPITPDSAWVTALCRPARSLRSYTGLMSPRSVLHLRGSFRPYCGFHMSSKEAQTTPKIMTRPESLTSGTPVPMYHTQSSSRNR